MVDETDIRAQVREDIRRYFLEQLASREPNQRRQDAHVGALVARIREWRGFDRHEHKLAEPIIMEELHRLVLGSVIRPGQDNSYDLPWLWVTEQGESLLRSEGPPVYDPDGYVEHVRREVANLPEVAAVYLGEAVSAFNLSRTLSAAVMLGVAAEAVLVHVISSFAASGHAANGAKLQMSLDRAPITQTYEEFHRQLDVKALPLELQRDLSVYLGNVLHFIRMTRNEAGHPTGLAVERPVIEAQLRAFEGYARRLCALADHFFK